jgi:tetratricopeptide (TPR) repeat protein
LEREQDNFRAALRWAIDNEGPTGEIALRIATALSRVFWQIHGHYRREALDWLSAAVSRSADARPSVRAAGLQMAGNQAFKLCELDRASAYLEESARLYRTLGSSTVPPEVLSTMARLAGLRGSYEEGSALLREAMTRASELGDNRTVQLGYWYLGEIQVLQGVWEEASATLEQGIAVSRELGDEHYAAHCANELGAVVRQQGDAERARRLHDESLAVFESLSDTEGVASALYYLGVLALGEADVAAAAARFQRSLALNAEIGYSQEIAPCLEGLAAVAAAGKEWHSAARLLGAAEAAREGIGVPLPPAERGTQESLRAALRNGLGEPDLAEALQIGRHMKLDEAAVLAGGSLDDRSQRASDRT